MRNLKLLFLVIISHLLFFFALCYYFYGESGGDLGIAMFTILSFILYIVVWGLISFRWSWRDKIYVLLGIIFTGIIETIIFNIMT
jgi:hypothetical protein